MNYMSKHPDLVTARTTTGRAYKRHPSRYMVKILSGEQRNWFALFDSESAAKAEECYMHDNGVCTSIIPPLYGAAQ